ncbi:multidrug effflux MFS transporter [Klenkia taihuensis]|uniref:MFS transporter, DHA1 family, bicyclomycin/chloramphenicol resistance protein n=1 Tax=Klenkia taihuensis TaxID=1225127 RepID=A0A1I1KKN9_9ACTN|nr:multidrug effflux MFS transporter [Klenkia taihuensis]GHE10407.1 Bcr/CflA family drug resistance efflux transporter [Klenkia taihuensis]SFC58000.1 MFS transporter, DHA1 family, bicyclomycin/chloramphenicol resistance protein [Klenkia taihuensis]
MVLLGALSAFGPLSMDLYLPALPSLEAEFGDGQGAAQLTLTSVAIGLAAGQLVAGPLSDRFGRRVPVLVGVGAYTLASVLCALSPSVWVLVGIRLLQGLAGAAGIVLARAVVRDTTEGVEAARAFALLASIGGAAPVLAPVLGGQLLRVTDWRGVFGVLAVIGLVLLLAAARRLPETLPADRRVHGGARASAAAARELLGQQGFRNAVLAQGLGFGALFTYISTSSFVLQSGYGLTPVQFSLVFAGNGVGIVLAGQVSRAVVARTGPRALLRAGLALQLAGGAGLVVAAVAGAGLPVVLPLLALVVSATGWVLPNATALAMAGAARTAGTASALVGAGQFAVAGVGAPLAGLGAPAALAPMAVVVAGFAVLGLVAALRVPVLPGPEVAPPA